MTQDVIDSLKEGEAVPGDDIRHLVNFWAVRVRATNHTVLISEEQRKKVTNEFVSFMDTLDKDTRKRFMDCILDEVKRVEKSKVKGENTFWKEPADTAIKLMGAGLAVGIGVA